MSDINAVALKYLRELRERRGKTPATPDQTVGHAFRHKQTIVPQTVVRNTKMKPDERYERLFRLALKSLPHRREEEE
jgi:hypothetical protein